MIHPCPMPLDLRRAPPHHCHELETRHVRRTLSTDASRNPLLGCPRLRHAISRRFLLGALPGIEEAEKGVTEPQFSMSSIKRDVKKNILPRPEARCFLEIQPTVIKLPWRSVTCAHSDQSPLMRER